MKWLIGCLLALVMVSAAFAGEDPYIGIVGNDIEFNSFYFSQKHQQFLFDQLDIDVPVCDGSFRQLCHKQGGRSRVRTVPVQ